MAISADQSILSLLKVYYKDGVQIAVRALVGN